MGTMLRWSILSLITLSACSGPTAPSPVGPAGGNQSMTGTWTGTISDSSGSMMGSGAMGPTATGAWSPCGAARWTAICAPSSYSNVDGS